MQSSSWSYGVKILEEMQVKNNNNKKIRSSCVLILINLPNVVFVYFVDKPFVNLRCFFRNTSQILFTIAYFPVPVIFARYSISGILATYILFPISFFYSLSKISMCDKNQLILHHLGFFWCEKFFYWDVSLYTYLCERNNNPSAWDNFLICILGQFWIKRPHHFFFLKFFHIRIPKLYRVKISLF